LLSGADRGRFPASYEIPGWSFHGGGGFTLDIGGMFGFPTGPIDMSGLMLFQTNPGTMLKDAFGKLIELSVNRIATHLAEAITAKKVGLPQPPADKTSFEYQAWLLAYGPGSEAVTKFNASMKFLEKFDNYLKIAMDANLWNGTATFESVFSKAMEPSKAELDGVTALVKTVMNAMIDKVFKPESNYALLMGGEKGVGALLFGLLDGLTDLHALRPDIQEFLQAVRKYVDYVIEKVADFTTIQHNRVYVPTSANFLTFETFSPWLLTPNVEMLVTITPIDGSLAPTVKRIRLEPGFWESTTHYIEIEPAYRGKIVTLTFQHVNSEEVVEKISKWSLPHNIDTTVLFDFDKWEQRDLSPESLAALEAQAEWVYNNRAELEGVKILGYTDPRGDADYNEELGLKRAQTVTHYIRQYLIDRGVDPSLVVAPESMGESKPDKITGAGEAAWSLQRRTVMKVVRHLVASGEEVDPDTLEPISQIFLLDKVRFRATTGGDPLELSADGLVSVPAPKIAAEDALFLLDAARDAWVQSGLFTGVGEALAGITLEVRPLAGNVLASFNEGVLTIDDDAAGYGWFIDATPGTAEEFTLGAASHLLGAIAGGAADGRVDLLTVLIHELGHGLGLADVPGTMETRVMNATLNLGERRLPSALDIVVSPLALEGESGSGEPGAIPTVVLTGGGGAMVTTSAATSGFAGGGPAVSALVNGDFSAADGWAAYGGGSVFGGEGVLAEDSRYLSYLRQSFAIPNGATELSFVIRSATLGAEGDMPPDAFEVALLDPVTGRSLLGSLTGLDLSDAFLNLQADGTLYLAPGVTVTGTPGEGAALVTVSLSGVARGNGAWLSFDLIGMGALDSRVVIDNVGFTTVPNEVPVARDDIVAGDEDTPILIDMLANDSDPDGDPLSVAIVAGPLNGTLTPPATPDGAWTYTPSADFFGTDSFTYSVTDGLSTPVTATVTINVRAVNDAPVLMPVADRSAVPGDALFVQLAASDVDDAPGTLTWTLVTGPEGAVLSSSGAFSWTVAGAGEQVVTVRVADAAGAFAEQTFRIYVATAGNAVPILGPIPPQTIGRGRELVLALSASDADDPIDTLIFSLTSGPAGAMVTPGGRFSWTAGEDGGPQSVTVRVTDPKGGFTERTFTITVLVGPNIAPVLAPIDDVEVNEGDTVSLQLQASDADDGVTGLNWSLVSAPAGAAVDAAGRFTWLAPDGDATASVTVRVTDGAGASDEKTFTIRVRDVAPVLTVTGGDTGYTASSYTVMLGSFDPGQDAPIEWIIDWGDGTTPTRVAGDAATASHRFADSGDYVIRAVLVNDDGSFSATPLSVSILATPPLLQVAGATISGGVLAVRFSAAITGGEAASQAVTLTGAHYGLVAGTIAYDADGMGFVLSRLDGRPLQYDSYSLILSDAGFLSRDGAVLDGDGNGEAGGDYRSTLLFAEAAAGSAALPDFMRGPGERVDAPREAMAGLQVLFASEGGVKTMTFRVTYDPALLRVDGVLRGVDLPADAVVQFRTEAAAGGKRVAIVTILSDTPIEAGNRWLVSFDATVPGNAPYGASEVLTVQVDSINAAAPAATQPDEALQLVGFYGDTDKDRALTLADLWRSTRIWMGLDKYFEAWPDAPPSLVAPIADYRPFDDGVRPLIDPPSLGQPIVSSEAAARPVFDPITYGTEAAVAKWAGDIHATSSARPQKAGGKDAAKSPAKAAAQQTPTATESAGTAVRPDAPVAAADAIPAMPMATLDFDATPDMLSVGVSVPVSPNGDWLSRLLAGDDDAAAGGEDYGHYAVLLPLVAGQRPEGSKKQPRRGRTDELEDSE
ncbi:MAG: Ig-like domain-containing protein, partial [Novosphingobium sp.]